MEMIYECVDGFQVDVTLENGTYARAAVPSGASTGTFWIVQKFVDDLI